MESAFFISLRLERGEEGKTDWVKYSQSESKGKKKSTGTNRHVQRWRRVGSRGENLFSLHPHQRVSESARKGFSCVINISTGRKADGESEGEEEKKKGFLCLQHLTRI